MVTWPWLTLTHINPSHVAQEKRLPPHCRLQTSDYYNVTILNSDYWYDTKLSLQLSSKFECCISFRRELDPKHVQNSIKFKVYNSLVLIRINYYPVIILWLWDKLRIRLQCDCSPIKRAKYVLRSRCLDTNLELTISFACELGGFR